MLTVLADLNEKKRSLVYKLCTEQQKCANLKLVYITFFEHQEMHFYALKHVLSLLKNELIKMLN